MRYTPGQRLAAALGVVLPIAGALAGGSIVPACGGSKRASTPLPGLPGEPDPGSGPVDCAAADPYEFYSIDDFEYGAATGWFTNNEVCYPWTQAVAECADAGMVCYPGSQASPECLRDGAPVGVWSSCFGSGAIDCRVADAALASCQAQCLSIQTSPSFNADPLPAAAIPNGRCGSSFYGMHVKAGPFTNWGGNIGTRFVRTDDAGRALGFDASSWDGIAVWMRTAPGFATAAKISIADQHTDSQYNMYPPSGATAFCDPNPNCQVQTSGGNTNCFRVGCDKFASYIPLTENWQLFLLPFQEMRQGGWGKQWPQVDVSQIVSIEVDYTQGSWDFWFDDISFYRRKAR